jgi:hypothetical protein
MGASPEGETAFLVRDRDNAYSRSAVEVRIENGYQIGYVPESEAVRLAPLFDAGCRHEAGLTKILKGGRVPVPVVQVYLYRSEARVQGTVTESEVPKRRTEPTGSSESTGFSACLVVTLVVIAVFVLFYILMSNYHF